MASSSNERNLKNLVINKVDSQSTFDQMKESGLINVDELYLIKEGTKDRVLDVIVNGESTVEDGISEFNVPTAVSELENDSGYITTAEETDPVFSASAAAGITSTDIQNWNNKTSNIGTITGVSVNGTSIATSGVANITSVPASILTGAIPNGVTATTQTQSDNSTKIATTAYVDTAIGNLPEPMVFKGSLGTGGTITALPTAAASNEGHTYKVIKDGTYAGQAAKIGDTFISTGSRWELIPSGDEPSGTVTSVTLNATSPIAIDNDAAITTSGTRTISHATSGVSAGTYKSVTVNSTGHVTGGTNPTTLSGYGITDAKIANGVITLGSNTITPLTEHQDIAGKQDKITTTNKLDYSLIDNTPDMSNYVPNTRTVNGKALSSNITLSASDTGAVAFNDTYITNANTFYSVNGYSKTSTSTTNLPSVCTGSDRWGVIFFIAENAANHTGTQMYFPIDGTYKGRIFYRSMVQGTPSTWMILPTKTSELTNDSGFLTEHQDISGKQDKITASNKLSYDLISGTPTIPTITDTYSSTSSDGMSGKAVASAISGKQNTLTTQTAYSAKGSATKVPQITTNTLGQVTGITEVTITDNDTKNTAGSTDTSSKIFLVGATSQAANSQTYSHDTAYVGTDGCLYSGGTKVLTAHQDISGKQDKLTTQTAYSAKGSATKVPQITTNTLGQVTGITEVTITQPTVNNGTLTIQKNGTNVQTFTANQSGNVTANITVPTVTDTYSETSSDAMSGKAVASALSSFSGGPQNIKDGDGTGSVYTSGATKPTADYAFAEGNITQASGECSHAEGFYTTSKGRASHAEGYGRVKAALNTTVHTVYNSENKTIIIKGLATTPYSKAIIDSYIAVGQAYLSTSAGSTQVANKIKQISEVSGSDARTIIYFEGAPLSNITSLAVDAQVYLNLVGSLASGSASHAEGDSTIATGTASHAEGDSTVASNAYAHAEGLGTVASYQCQHVEGKYNKPGSFLHIVGNGTDNDNRSNAHTLDSSGNAWFAGNIKIGGSSYSDSDAKTINVIANLKDGDGAGSVYTSGANKPTANYTFAEGYRTNAQGEYSHAEGCSSIASGENSHAENGAGVANATTYASGTITSISSDQKTFTISGMDMNLIYHGFQSHDHKITGVNKDFTTNIITLTFEKPINSYSVGQTMQLTLLGNQAIGESSHAEGIWTVAAERGSHAEGYCTSTNREFQHVQGRLNAPDSSALFIIGNGYSGDKSNAMTVQNSGDLWVSGNIKVGGTKYDNATATVLTSENFHQYVDAYVQEILNRRY